MFRVLSLGRVESTNNEVKRAIDAGEPEGLAVRALCQSGGYGRQGRAWSSPEGGLYFSLLLRPQVQLESLATVALLAGLAVRRALAGLVPLPITGCIKVKWPNDVVAEGASIDTAGSSFAKLCGISSEVHRGAVCIGVGVNVLPPSDYAAVPASCGKNAPIYLADLMPVDTSRTDDLRDRAFVAILGELEELYPRWCAEGFGAFASDYAASEALSGKRLAIVDRSGSALVSGMACGVADDGRLLVKADDGSVVCVASGEAHIL